MEQWLRFLYIVYTWEIYKLEMNHISILLYEYESSADETSADSFTWCRHTRYASLLINYWKSILIRRWIYVIISSYNNEKFIYMPSTTWEISNENLNKNDNFCSNRHDWSHYRAIIQLYTEGNNSNVMYRYPCTQANITIQIIIISRIMIWRINDFTIYEGSYDALNCLQQLTLTTMQNDNSASYKNRACLNPILYITHESIILFYDIWLP